MKDIENYIRGIKNRLINETIDSKVDEILEKLNSDEFDYVAEGNLCECGGSIYENECIECGKMYEDDCMECGGKKLDILELEDPSWFEETDDIIRSNRFSKDKYDKWNLKGKKHHNKKRQKYDDKDEDEILFDLEIDEDDMGEGNAFGYKLKKAREDGDDEFELGGRKIRVTNESILYSLSDEKGSELFTEDEVIDLIESIVNEENVKSNIKKGVTPVGLATYEKAHKGSKKENDEYLNSVVKKLKDYLKDGSKGDFEMDPKKFPKGNGELEKMKAKKYTMSDDGKEFLDDFMHPGMEDLVPDEIQYDEDWVDDLIGGASRTGNNSEWANGEETDLGEKLNKKRKTKKFHNAKMMAYRKSPQPVTDGTGENSGSGVNIKVENTNEKQKQKLNEEFSRIQQLMGYTKKTQ